MPRLITDHLLTASGRIGCRLFALMGLGLFTLWQAYQWLLSGYLPPIISIIVMLGLIYMGLCLINQRLHDVGCSGWWAGPILGGLLAVGLAPHAHPALLPTSVLGLVMALSLIPGNKSHNRYGPRPTWKDSGLSGPEPGVHPSSPDQRRSGRTT